MWIPTRKMNFWIPKLVNIKVWSKFECQSSQIKVKNQGLKKSRILDNLKDKHNMCSKYENNHIKHKSNLGEIK